MAKTPKPTTTDMPAAAAAAPPLPDRGGVYRADGTGALTQLEGLPDPADAVPAAEPAQPEGSSHES